jgi:hypothetical protein
VSTMLYAVAWLFVGIVSTSLLVSLPLLYIQNNYWINFIVVVLCSIVAWLYMDNLSILYDVGNRERLRREILDIITTIGILHAERDEVYRDIRQIRKIRHREVPRRKQVRSTSCNF